MAVRDLKRLREEIHKRLYKGIAAMTDDAAEIYRDAVSIPVEFTVTSKGVRAIRSKPGEYPRLETGQGQENISSEATVDTTGVRGGFGLMGPEAGIGPYERTESDIPGHFEAGGFHMAMLAGAENEAGYREFFNEGRRKGPQDVFSENLFALQRSFKNAASSGGGVAAEVPF